MKPSAVVHFEMPYKDQDRVVKFYADAFGWQMNKTGPEYGGYVTAGTAETDANNMVLQTGAINGGFFPDTPEVQGPKVTRVVIGVEDIQAAIKAVESGGGKVLGQPVEIPQIGLWVNFTDSEGNLVGLIQGEKK